MASGIAYLLGEQRADGSWFEVPYTGTGFPRVFYLKYHMYFQYFPLLASNPIREVYRVRELGYWKRLKRALSTFLASRFAVEIELEGF